VGGIEARARSNPLARKEGFLCFREPAVGMSGVGAPQSIGVRRT